MPEIPLDIVYDAMKKLIILLIKTGFQKLKERLFISGRP